MSRIISITGDLGSGKSTVSAILTEQLGYGYVYTGKIQREIAARHNMTTLELNRFAETHPEIDAEIDDTFRALNGATDLVVDSRLAWFFLPDSFKIYLKTSPVIAAKRVAADRGRKSEGNATPEEMAGQLALRKASENRRYAELYGADCTDVMQFDLLVDCSYLTPERVAEIIVASYNRWMQSGNRAWFVSPRNLYPVRLPEPDDRIDAEVFATSIDGFDFVVSGIGTVSTAIRNDVELLPVVYHRPDDFLAEKNISARQFVMSRLTPDVLTQWEKYHGFSFLHYPKIN